MPSPLFSFPFDAPVHNALEAEFRERPWKQRVAARRKLVQRLGLLWVTGQASRLVERVPPGVRSMLWIYSWTTVGDAILDLAPRTLVPAEIDVDLCIAPSLEPLFATDGRFRRVYTEPADTRGAYDFVLLDTLSTRSIRLKGLNHAGVPFATLRGHLEGERYDRAGFSDRRLRQLFGLPSGEVVAPSLQIEPISRMDRATSTRIAVVLGARVVYKHYPHWPRVLEAARRRWPTDMPPPCFWLLGQGAAAREDRESIASAFLAAHCVDMLDSGSLRDAALQLTGCDAFLGVDGGLMHVAAALGVPGLALFTGTDPRYFLRPGSPIVPMPIAGPVADLPPDDVADALIEKCRALHDTAAAIGATGVSAEKR